jgi:hypothetical protein
MSYVVPSEVMGINVKDSLIRISCWALEPIEAYINGVGPNALNPLDTGFVDVCFGDSILFVAKPIFPHSLETTGYGYSQNVNTNIDFDWEITDGGTYPQNDSIWFTACRSFLGCIATA